MNDKNLFTLEFDTVLQRLASHTAFSASHELALALRPTSDSLEAERRQQFTSEARRLLELKSNLTIGGARDVREQAERARRGGVLEPPILLDIQATLASARLLRTTIGRLADHAPALADLASTLVPLPYLEDEIARCIGPRGEILDDASPALRRLRSEVRSAQSRVQERLMSFIGGAGRAIVQEPLVTLRQGRYVVPLKAEFKGQVKCLVHDTSASGATLYVEPFDVVDLNNRWRQLQIEEEREVERVVRALSEAVGTRAADVIQNVETIAEIDLILAKARFAEDLRATEPRFAEDGVLRFVNARHPLLRGHVVPITVELGDHFFVLVITGPNTGGKTVALKTVGLLAAMAQAGLHVPADEGSQVPIYDGIYADIGDEQSIEQSLSTFSSHVANIVGILSQAGARSLVLLDELGAGTDPAEGSALARAILLHQIAHHIPTIATTHYSELKAFAHTTVGVQNASVEFDVETLSPTYRLMIGLPGRSNALAIAARLGMPDEILGQARSLLSPEELQVEQLLAAIHAEREDVRTQQATVAAERAQVEAERERLRRELQRLEQEKERVLDDARRQAMTELAATRRQVAEIATRARHGAASLPQTRRALNALEEAVAAKLPSTTEPPRVETESAPVKPGDAVWVRSLNQAGQIVGRPDARGEVDVQLGSFKAHLKMSDLEKIKRGPSAPERENRPTIVAATTEGIGVSMNLDLRGRRADEVADEVERYLNDAYMASLPLVRLIHGKGTGVLRQIVRQQLAAHPLVRSFTAADPEQGGDGVTIANLVTR